MEDKDIQFLKDIERSKKKEQQFKEKQEKNKQFEEASQGAYFTLFNTVTGAVTAVTSLAVIEFFLWNNSKTLFVIVTLLLFATVILRQLAKYYFMKGKQKKFETFNKLSKATGVVSSVADATVLKGSKGMSASNKADATEAKITGAIDTLAEMQFNGGVYKDVKYDAMRERCRRMGVYIYTTQTLDYIHDLLQYVHASLSISNLSKNANISANLFLLYVQDFLKKSYEKADYDLFCYVLGAIYFYKTPLKELANNIPMVGYKDNMFGIYCVYAGCKDDITTYADWKMLFMRSAMMDKYLRDDSILWSSLQAVILPEDNKSFMNDFYRNLEDFDIDSNFKFSAELLMDMLHMAWLQQFTDIEPELISGLEGFATYVVSKGDLQLQGVSGDKYFDVVILIQCCLKRCENALNTFQIWKVLHNLYEDSDPLHEYLDTVIGNSKNDREEEVQRLSKMCQNKVLTDDYDRARFVLYRQFGTNSMTAPIPNDMHEWAERNGMSDGEAIKYFLSLLPDYFIKEETDCDSISVYWNNYKHVVQ